MSETEVRRSLSDKFLAYPFLKQTQKQKMSCRGSRWESEDVLSLVIVAVVGLVFAQAALVDVFQRVGVLQRQLRRADGRQHVLLWEHPRLQGRVVFPFPLRVLQSCLVDLPHGLRGQRRWDIVWRGTETKSVQEDDQVFTLGATNWETLFTTHFGNEPAETEDSRGQTELLATGRPVKAHGKEVWGGSGKLFSDSERESRVLLRLV